jgi:chromosome segregation ATPase
MNTVSQTLAMKTAPQTSPTPRYLCCALVILSCFLGAGCANRGILKGKDTSGTVTDAASQVETTRQQLVNTTNALSVLTRQPTYDLKGALDRYKASVDGLEKSVKGLNAEAESMRNQGQKYFATWDAQLAKIQDENMRAKSIARQQELGNQFTAVQQQYASVQQNFRSLISRLRDIERIVRVDKTPTGVQTVQEFAKAAESDANTMRQTLDKLAENLHTMSGALAAVTSAPVS